MQRITFSTISMVNTDVKTMSAQAKIWRESTKTCYQIWPSFNSPVCSGRPVNHLVSERLGINRVLSCQGDGGEQDEQKD